MDQLEQMPLIRCNDIYALEKFADLVRITVVKLQAEGKDGELGDGTLHSLMLKKLPGTRNIRPPCSLCQSPDHGVWFCKQFYDKGVDDRWQFAKERKLCFRCLATDHRGKDCRKARICGIEGCPRNHHRLLHGLENLSETGPMTTLPRVDAERRPVVPWEGVPVVTMTSCNAETD